ncbi:CGA synthase-related protein [Streptomyces sp. NPDC006704]|uniref:CGA synthase-related protein n=1 Tax=Streptomyces sp. NPDC006704 TaxID=3364760 RepID=UPI0036CFF4F7
MSSPTLSPRPAPPRLRVVAASRDDLESRATLRYIAAHLTEVELVGEQPGGPAPDAAVVCDDTALAERLSASGVPVVFVDAGGAAAADGWPSALVRCQHRPGWLPSLRVRGVHGVGTIAPPRSARARAARGAVIQLSTPAGLSERTPDFARSHAVLRAAVDAVRGAGLPALALVLDAPRAVRDALVDAGGIDAGPGAPEVAVHSGTDAATEHLLAQASVLLSSPLLSAVNQAHATRVPLLLLPALDTTQARRLDMITEAVGAGVLDPDRPQEAVEAAVQGGDALWERVTAALNEAGDDRRGAQRVARQVRQLLLAPF